MIPVLTAVSGRQGRLRDPTVGNTGWEAYGTGRGAPVAREGRRRRNLSGKTLGAPALRPDHARIDSKASYPNSLISTAEGLDRPAVSAIAKERRHAAQQNSTFPLVSHPKSEVDTAYDSTNYGERVIKMSEVMSQLGRPKTGYKLLAKLRVSFFIGL